MTSNNNKVFMNIIWDVLFKFNMVLMPIVISWGVWVTSNIYDLKAFKNQGARVTIQDLELSHNNTKEWVRNNYPPKALQDDFNQFRITINQIQKDISLLIYKVDSQIELGRKTSFKNRITGEN